MGTSVLGDGNLNGLLHGTFPPPPETCDTVQKILARKRQFGITRLGSVTGLDRIGIPVVQVTRPASRSVTVNQGKGLTYSQAAISGLMELLEGWASERIPTDRVWEAEFEAMNGEGLWSHLLTDDIVSARSQILSWIKGWDIMSGMFRPVPLGLVDTNYVIPSPHPHWLTRNTTGLAAGSSLQMAMTHACLEILERHAHCLAMRTPHFFDRFQIGNDTIRTGMAGDIIGRLRSAGFVAGVWTIPSDHGLPVYWCQVMESARQAPLAPLPAAGFGCDISHDRALTKALLETCQSRLGAISAARGDVTGSFYRYTDNNELSAWRGILSRAGQPYPTVESRHTDKNALKMAWDAMVVAGARAVVVVVLFSDETIPLHVVRIVAPPLEVSIDG